jgi:heme o synthase
MLVMVNLATGLLGVASLLTYVLVYTPLKRHTYLALLVGAVPGAMPPLMGWTTVTGAIGVGGALLFAVLFLWQSPHFAAISLFRAEDYARAGLKVVSVQHGEGAARRTIALYSVLLVVASLLFVPLGIAGRVYAAVATMLGAAFLAMALRGAADRSPVDRGAVDGGAADRGGAESGATRAWAKQVFALSIPYLTLLLFALLLDRRS